MKRCLRVALVAVLALALAGGCVMATRQHMPERGYWGWEMPDGTIFYLTPSNGIHVDYVGGAGMPPVRNIITPYAIADGGHYQRTKTLSSTLTFVLSAVGETDYGLRLLRTTLIDAVSHHNVGRPPIRLFYFGLAHKLYLDVVYDAGLEGGPPSGQNAEKLAIRFIAPDPYWSDAVNTRTGALESFTLLENVRRIAMRSPDGAWTNLGGGTNNLVYDVLFAPDGTLYATGQFTAAGIAVAKIARWTGTAWAALGAGLGGGDGYCMAWGPDGNLYVGGSFTTAGGGAANRVARWDPTAAAWYALGAGLDAAVWDMAFGNDGRLYVAGAFANAGGAPAACAAVWDGAAWAALGAGLDAAAYAVDVAPDGRVYFGGSFANAGGAAAVSIAVWNPTTSAWAALGAGMSAGATVMHIMIAENGVVYAFGSFTTAGGIAALGAAHWNGVSWQAMGAGFTSGGVLVGSGDFAPDGTIYVGGGGLVSGYPILPNFAFWRDPLWIAGDGDTDGLTVEALAIHTDGTLVIAGNFNGWLRYPYYLTITNDGNARSFPVFTVLGPGRLYHIVNYTTGQRLDFDLDMMTGEVITIDLQVGQKTVMSSVRGNLTGKCIGGSLSTWALAPGANYVAIFVDGVLIGNGNFETLGGGGADVFASWVEQGAVGDVVASATSHSGAYAARLTGGAGGAGEVWAMIAVSPGQQMHLEFWARGDGAVAGNYRVVDETNSADIIAYTSTGVAGATYTLVEVDFTIPAGCVYISVRLIYPGLGGTYAYFDDVSLTDILDHSYSFTPRYMGIDKAAD